MKKITSSLFIVAVVALIIFRPSLWVIKPTVPDIVIDPSIPTYPIFPWLHPDPVPGEDPNDNPPSGGGGGGGTTPPPEEPPETPPPQTSELALLSTSGTSIVDGSGNTVVLKGLQVHNAKTKEKDSPWGSEADSPYDSYFTEEVIQEMKDYGVNFFEVTHLRVQDIINGKGEIDERYFDYWIDHWVTWCSRNEVYLCISLNDFKQDGDPTATYYMPSWMWDEYGWNPNTWSGIANILHDFYDDSVNSMDDERELWYKAWVYIATRYKDNPYVTYNLCNEPMHMTYDYMGDSANRYHLGRTYSRIMSECIRRMRAAGSNQIVFIDRPYLNDDSGEYLKYIADLDTDIKNVVWELHQYNSGYHILSRWKTSVDAAYTKFCGEFGKPLHIGEMGFWPPEIRYERSSWRNELTEMRVFMDQRHLEYTFHAIDWFMGYGNLARHHGYPRAYTPEETKDILGIMF